MRELTTGCGTIGWWSAVVGNKSGREGAMVMTWYHSASNSSSFDGLVRSASSFSIKGSLSAISWSAGPPCIPFWAWERMLFPSGCFQSVIYMRLAPGEASVFAASLSPRALSASLSSVSEASAVMSFAPSVRSCYLSSSFSESVCSIAASCKLGLRSCTCTYLADLECLLLRGMYLANLERSSIFWG